MRLTAAVKAPQLTLTDIEIEAYYGRDAGDRIPFERVELFLAKGLLKRAQTATAAA